MKIDLAGRTALVTGAGHGFGRAIAVGLAKVGATVFACDILDDELPETAAIAGPSCHIRRLDVTDAEAIRSTVREIEAAGHGIDILVNNAGGVLGQVGRPIEEISLRDWQGIFDVNLTGAFLTAQALAPGMKARRFGRIVNISSGAGLGISLTGIQAYASAKAGQIGLTRQLAHELGPWNITVNNVAPGFVRSNPASERQWHAMGEDGQEKVLQGIALKRLGTPEDIANAVLFFASEHAGWISGQVLSVDGGK
ncbi:3-oxoacyl-[acyl-carrier protein] reductase [Faunimonas pinastri]|uniref:3-oxoacyl-[acyl-carrier protein] reductase n=1 Tax=Faunimonas pinastri TaxID=1855383 RepID=A0A1H9IBW1_9HYPH|nr:SDR family NAD(P)-dependent oxidoreductase [Faunimonas pinastri]SEQ72073.1 3-oxoacyl-[acyl-carrier protein] reductase [Faunimonas pinastri]